jgi:hypothetical protein
MKAFVPTNLISTIPTLVANSLNTNIDEFDFIKSFPSTIKNSTFVPVIFSCNERVRKALFDVNELVAISPACNDNKNLTLKFTDFISFDECAHCLKFGHSTPDCPNKGIKSTSCCENPFGHTQKKAQCEQHFCKTCKSQHTPFNKKCISFTSLREIYLDAIFVITQNFGKTGFEYFSPPDFPSLYV